MYYTVIKHSGHLRTLEKCRKHSPAARVFYISLVFSNARRVLSQCNTRLRLLYLLNICINELIDNGDLREDIGKLLKATDSRTPIFDMLPKVHKPNNPGRPVVSSVNSRTEKLSAYVNEFLRPLAEKLPSRIKDTTDFIKRLRELGRVPENCILATLDVSSLYTMQPILTQTKDSQLLRRN